MSLAYDWPLPLAFAIVALILAGLGALALRANGSLNRWKLAVIGCAALAPPAIIVIGILDSWRFGQPHDGSESGMALTFCVELVGWASAICATAACAMACRRAMAAALAGSAACLALLPVTAVALLAAGQMIAGVSL